MQGEPDEPCHPDPAVAADAEPRLAPAETVRGLVLVTVKVPDLALVMVKVRGLVLD